MSVEENSNLDSSDVAGAIKDLQMAVNTDEALTEDAVTMLANAAGQTLTAASLLGGYIMRSGAAAVSDTTPTAALIVAAIPHAIVGTAFDFTIRNKNSDTLTILAGNGVTLEGVTTIATDFTRRYVGKITNVGTPAVTIHGVSTSAV
jgi:hypothetical protein